MENIDRVMSRYVELKRLVQKSDSPDDYVYEEGVHHGLAEAIELLFGPEHYEKFLEDAVKLLNPELWGNKEDKT